MQVRHDFEEMPPKPFMDLVMDHIAKAYCFLWNKKDSNFKLRFTWTDLTKQFNKNNFRNIIRRLNNLGLLNYEESQSGIIIELVRWDEVCDE